VIPLLTKIFAFLAVIAGLAAAIYKNFIDPKEKAKKEAEKKGEQAVDDGDTSAVTAALDKINKTLMVFLCVFVLAGCQRAVVLHPIDKVDIMRIKANDTLTAPKDGYFISDLYLKEVMQAKVQ